MDGRPKRIKKFASTSVCVYNRLRVDGALERGVCHLAACSDNNRPFARWRHFTTTTRILFVFPLICKFGSPSGV